MLTKTLLGLTLISASALADFTGRVVGVHDGDTLTVLRGGRGETVRLVEIDAPELAQDFGYSSKQSLARLCYGQTAVVRETGTDRYGRVLGRVNCAGRDANAEQIQRGMAWFYTKYGTETALRRAEQTARDTRSGLWARPDAVPPWDYRHRPGGGWLSVNQAHPKTEGQPKPPAGQPPEPPAGKWDCSGAGKYCKAMQSCEEAKFYLNQCGAHRLDRDGDGIPCENVCGK